MAAEPASGAGLFGADLAADPRPTFAELRKGSPVLRLPDLQGFGDGGVVILSRYEDVHFALRHPEVFSSTEAAVDIGQDRPLIPLQVDPPDHAGYRRLLDPHFSPRAVNGMEGAVRELAAELIEGFAARGRCDFHAEFATPFPATIFLRLMGLPMEELPMFLRWRDGIIRPQVDPSDLDGARTVRKQTGQEIYAFFDAVIDDRLASPQDDLMTAFLTDEIEGRRLSRDEVLDMCYLFILGGLDTVTASLDCLIARLAQHPEERQRLVDDPSLIDGAVEELLRFETPVMGVPRLVVADVTLDGVEVKAGERAILLLHSADTDEAEFDGADEVDFGRERNRHFAFGGGPHRCLGSHLARRELKVALEELHRRIPEYSLAPGAELSYSPGIRQVDPLPIVFPVGAR
ncbi:MAG: cytochrome P450 [Actinobacteria bacterium]|nr:cytochrome P450 [Actinomycetota bacterium]